MEANQIKEFLSANRETVISFYHKQIEPFHSVTLTEFMWDVFNNFKKQTTSPDLKKYDLFGNLEDAKARCGTFDHRVGGTEVKPNHSNLSEAAKRQLPSSMR